MKDARGHGSNGRGVAGGSPLVAKSSNMSHGIIPTRPYSETNRDTGPGGRLPSGNTSDFAGRDAQGRTYTQAVRDHDRFRSQNPTFPNADDYRTPVEGGGKAYTSNQEAARGLMGALRSTQAPIHSGMFFRSSREK